MSDVVQSINCSAHIPKGIATRTKGRISQRFSLIPVYSSSSSAINKKPFTKPTPWTSIPAWLLSLSNIHISFIQVFIHSNNPFYPWSVYLSFYTPLLHLILIHLLESVDSAASRYNITLEANILSFGSKSKWLS